MVVLLYLVYYLPMFISQLHALYLYPRMHKIFTTFVEIDDITIAVRQHFLVTDQ